VDTRLRKIAEGLADATVLAAAGLARLGIGSWPGLVFQPLEIGRMVPAVGQGAIALQCRSGDAARFAAGLDAGTSRAVAVERALQADLGAGCHTAFGAHAAVDRIHVYHEDIGWRDAPLAAGDFLGPAAAAARLLPHFGLRR
jgi:hydroxymethylbilane synthase